MKKAICIILMIVLALPCVASADVLSDGWEDAGLDALLDAQELIAQRIEVVKLEEAFEKGSIYLSGSGTTIVSEIVSVKTIPARIVVRGQAKVSLLDGVHDRTYNTDKDNEYAYVIGYEGDYQVLVEGKGEWEISIEPVKYGGDVNMRGTGPFVSDFFDFDGPIIVQCVMDMTKADTYGDRMSVRMGRQYENIDGWCYDYIIEEKYYSNSRVEEDGIINNVGNQTQYFWIVDVPEGVEWSITAK